MKTCMFSKRELPIGVMHSHFHLLTALLWRLQHVDATGAPVGADAPSVPKPVVTRGVRTDGHYIRRAKPPISWDGSGAPPIAAHALPTQEAASLGADVREESAGHRREVTIHNGLDFRAHASDGHFQHHIGAALFEEGSPLPDGRLWRHLNRGGEAVGQSMRILPKSALAGSLLSEDPPAMEDSAVKLLVAEKENSQKQAEALAIILCAFVVLIASVIYLLNCGDADIVRNTWKTLSEALGLFIAILIFFTDKDLLTLLLVGEEGLIKEDRVKSGKDVDTSILIYSLLRLMINYAVLMFLLWQFRGKPTVLHSIGNLGANLIAFSAADFFGYVQETPPFNISASASLLAIPLVITFGLTFRIVGQDRRAKLLQNHQTMNAELRPAEGEQRAENQGEIGRGETTQPAEIQGKEGQEEGKQSAESQPDDGQGEGKQPAERQEGDGQLEGKQPAEIPGGQGLRRQDQVNFALDAVVPEYDALHEWDHQCARTDDRFVSFTCGLLISQFCRFSIIGTLPPMYGYKKKRIFGLDKTMALASCALAFGLVAIVVGVFKDRPENPSVKAVLGTLQAVMSMSMAWCLHFWSKWFFYYYTTMHGVLGTGWKMIGKVIMATIYTPFGFFIIILNEKIIDKIPILSGLRSLNEGFVLLIGLAWEKTFMQAMLSIEVEEANPTNEALFKAGSSISLVLFIAPAWAMYIQSKAIVFLPRRPGNGDKDGTVGDQGAIGEVVVDESKDAKGGEQCVTEESKDGEGVDHSAVEEAAATEENKDGENPNQEFTEEGATEENMDI